jgi:hypothetical protein
VTPYFRQHRPPALVATLPPIVDDVALAGSGGYHRPCSATAALTSLLITQLPAKCLHQNAHDIHGNRP